MGYVRHDLLGVIGEKILISCVLHWQGTQDERATGLAVGPRSTIYVAGLFTSPSFSLGGYSIVKNGTNIVLHDLYYAKLSTVNGSCSYITRVGSALGETYGQASTQRGPLAVDMSTGDFFLGAYVY
jgi:hypothetical protein